MEKLYSLKEIFNGRLLRVPDYQRGYAWGDRQLEDFWDDIQNLTERRKHYTGMLSLRKLNDKETSGWLEEQWAIDNYDCFHVVDGQQRLTTFVILLMCIIERVRSLSKNAGKKDEDIAFATQKLNDIVRTFIVEINAEYETEKVYKFGYETDNPSFRFLRHEIFGERIDEELVKSFYTLNLKNAKGFFETRINVLAEDEASLEAALRVIYQKITQDLVFVVQEISDDFDVFVAFETMNNRGLTLSALEKLKNRLIYLTTLYDHSELPETRYVTLRKEINDAWAEVYKQLGRNESHRLDDDDYLRNHYFLYWKYARSGNEKRPDEDLLYRKFTSKAALTKGKGHLTPAEIEAYARDLSRTAKYWYYTFNPAEWKEISEEERKWIAKLNRLEMAYFRPIIVAAYMDPRSSSEDRLTLLKSIERFVFILFRTLSGFTSQYGSTVYLAYAKSLRDGTMSLQELIDSLDDTVDRYQNIFNGFKTRIDKLFDSRDGFYSWDGIRHFLFEYEQELVLKNGSPKIDASDFFKRSEKDRFTIEHIYPQTHNTVYYWADGFRFFSDREKDLLCGSLGNLLPLASSVNSEMQNYPYPEKRNGSQNSHRRGYINGSYSEIEVSVGAQNDWTYEDIKQRGLDLLAFLEKRWRVTIGDEAAKLQLLHLEFLESVDVSVPHLEKFADVTKVSHEAGAKSLRREFWINLSNALSLDKPELSIPGESIGTGYLYWPSPKTPGRFVVYADIKEGTAKVIVHVPKSDLFERLRPMKQDIDDLMGFDSDWDSKNGTASYRKAILYSVSFTMWEKS
ncbi:MAG: DUF262 domain-containing HNH endonuclease family protein, partial [Candidatus Enteromonas sp.]|nr:DUF262 domain-containing HNH endonuclease family protein [Candidatus Enteromonas sp.]